MSCLYFIKNKNSDLYYVGSTSQFNKRIDRHFKELKKGIHHCSPLQEAYDQDVDGFYVVTEYFEDIGRARIEEQKVLDGDYNKLYNISKHSTCGDLISYHPNKKAIIEKMTKSLMLKNEKLTAEEKSEMYGSPGEKNPMFKKTHTTEARVKMSVSSKGNTYALGYKWTPEQRAKLSKIASERVGDKNPFFGKKHSEEYKRKASERMKGKPAVNKRSVSIEGKTYESLTFAAKELGVVTGTILHRIKSPNAKYKSYHYVD